MKLTNLGKQIHHFDNENAVNPSLDKENHRAKAQKQSNCLY